MVIVIREAPHICQFRAHGMEVTFIQFSIRKAGMSVPNSTRLPYKYYLISTKIIHSVTGAIRRYCGKYFLLKMYRVFNSVAVRVGDTTYRT